MNIVIDYLTQTHSLDVPADVPLQRITPAIARKLELPDTELDGSIYVYYFADNGELLDETQTLAQLNIEEGAVLDFVQEQITPQESELVTTAPNPDPTISIQISPLTRQQSRQRTARRFRRYTSLNYLFQGIETFIFLSVILCGGVTFLSFCSFNSQLEDANVPVFVMADRQPVQTPNTKVSKLLFRNQQNGRFSGFANILYRPITDELFVAQRNELVRFNIHTYESERMQSFQATITHLLLSPNGRYLVARLANSTLYWQDLETGENEDIKPPTYEPIKDLDIFDNGKIVLIRDDIGHYVSYHPPANQRFFVSINSFALEASPHFPLMYGFRSNSRDKIFIQKYDTSSETISLQHEQLADGSYPFCTPIWVGHDSELLINNCSEVAFHASDNPDIDLDVAFPLPNIKNILAFADTPHALFFLLSDNPSEVVVWPLDESEPYTVPVEFGNGRYIFTDYDSVTKQTELIIFGQDNFQEHHFQITELSE